MMVIITSIIFQSSRFLSRHFRITSGFVPHFSLIGPNFLIGLLAAIMLSRTWTSFILPERADGGMVSQFFFWCVRG